MKNEIITFTSPKSSVSEVFRTLRTNIQFMNMSNKSKSILVTSTVPGEGKSWVSANLAITFAQAGKKVILVDADMRRGRQHEVFEVSNEKGLSNYLISAVQESKTDLAEYIKPTLIENLFILTAGVVPPNPSELLTSSKMFDLIKILEKSADIVIFDGTPSTIVTDALILAKDIGSTLLVSAYKQTKMENLKQIKKSIENVGGRVSGVVVNKIPNSQKVYGNGYYYESSITINNKENWFSNLFKKLSQFINEKKEKKQNEVIDVKMELPKVEETKIIEEKPKRKTTKKQKESEINNQNEEDIDINVVLKQLTKYLSEDKK